MKSSQILLACHLALFASFANVCMGLASTCSGIIRRWEGVIHSPHYPEAFPNNSTSCTWYFFPPSEHVTSLNIEVLDLDLDRDPDCVVEPFRSCCTQSWLSVPFDQLGVQRNIVQLCGNDDPFEERPQRNFLVKNPGVNTHVKFHASGNEFKRRGFKLHYSFGPSPYPPREKCEPGLLTCDHGKCVHKHWRCDGIPHCQDGVDEAGCPGERADIPVSSLDNLCTNPFEVDCGPSDSGCFNNQTQRCDGRRDCRTSGLDEDGCPNCPRGTMPCKTHGCYHISQTCDGVPDCTDRTDEADCGFCPYGQVECRSQPGKCYSTFGELCNGYLDCPLGEDETDCEPHCKETIACANGRGCYHPSERCNLVEDCDDGSDELHCKHGIASRDKFECDSGGSIAQRLSCDGVDDCADGSDEQNCIRNSVITAAIMGSLLCGLLLVIAVGCTCRLYSLSLKGVGSSNANSNSPLQSASTSSQTVPSSSRMCAAFPPVTVYTEDEEFYFREPPPAYSVAVGEAPPPPCPYAYQSSNCTQPRVHSGNDRSRRPRRHSSSRRNPPRVSGALPPQATPDLPPLPPYSPTPSGSLPPYTPTAADQTRDSQPGPTVQFAPPPTVKVMESLLQAVNVEQGSSIEETTSDGTALMETPPLSPSPSPSASSSHENLAAVL